MVSPGEFPRSLQQILLVDDDPNDRLLTARELHREFETLHIYEIKSWDEFERALEAQDFDLIITDYDLRWATGLDVLRTAKKRHPHCPVVMFTDSGSQELAVEAMKAGLEDYVLKSPKHLMRLCQAVRSVWENAQMRRRASELEFRLQFLLNELGVGVFRATPTGQLLEVSNGLLRLIGVANLSEAQTFFQTHFEMAAEDFDHERQRHREIQISAEGKSRWFKVSETLADQNGNPLIDGLLSEITEPKQTAAELRSLNQTLEQRVAQRTDRLVTLNRELEMFAFSVSHDLRSPIRQIDGFAALLEDQFRQRKSPVPETSASTLADADDENIDHYLNRIRMLTERAGKMIDDLLQFSRTGRTEMQYTLVSMARLVQEVMRQVEPQLQGRQVRWQVGELPVVWGDRILLFKVWQNLIENAMKYTREQPVVEIIIGSEIRDRDTVFFIRDNGIGFNMEEASQLFGVFQRLPNAQAFDGSGIGLANVQRVIHRHQGQLWAEGQINAGATFYFSMPHKDDGV